MWTRRPKPLALCAAWLGLLCFASPAFAGVSPVDEILMLAFREDTGGGAMWRLAISVEAEGGGSVPAPGTVTPPSGPVINLVVTGGSLEFESGPFATLALLQATYPAGDYDFSIGGETVTLNWNPTHPVATVGEPSVSIVSPADGSTKQSNTPDVSYALDCTNCKDIVVNVFDVATDGNLADFEFSALDQTPGMLPNPVLFSSMTQLGPLSQLPDETNEAELIVGLATFSDETFDPPTSAPSFTYVSGAALVDRSQFGVGPADSDFTVDDVLIEATREDPGAGFIWTFIIEVDGTMLPSTATVSPPSGPPIMLMEGASAAGFVLEFEDTDFATFADLQMDHPAGDYAFQIGEETVTLHWDPTPPLGAAGEPTVAITQPAGGAVGVSPQPDVQYTFDCTNCKDMDLQLFDVASDGMNASFGFSELDVMPAGNFTNPVPFGSMSQSGIATELPIGLAEAEILIGLASFSTENFDMPTNLGSFQYIEAATVADTNRFLVPLPRAALVQVTALAALSIVARRRRT